MLLFNAVKHPAFLGILVLNPMYNMHYVAQEDSYCIAWFPFYFSS